MKQFPKIQNACAKDDLRPVMNYVFITKEHAVASNTHILVCHDSTELFNKDFIEKLPDHPILIHREDFSKIGGKECHVEIHSDNVIKVHYKKNRPVLIEYEKEDKIGKFPNYKAVIPEEFDAEINGIGLNPEFLITLRDSITSTKNTVQLYFKGEEYAINVKIRDCEFNNYKAIIMPITLK